MAKENITQIAIFSYGYKKYVTESQIEYEKIIVNARETAKCYMIDNENEASNANSILSGIYKGKLEKDKCEHILTRYVKHEIAFATNDVENADELFIKAANEYFDKKINEHKTALEKFTGLKDHLEYEASK